MDDVTEVGLVMAFTKLRGVRWVRVAFQLVLIGYLGLVNGHLLSQALFVGWAQNGLAWQFAPGLILLAAVALLVPIVERHDDLRALLGADGVSVLDLRASFWDHADRGSLF